MCPRGALRTIKSPTYLYACLSFPLRKWRLGHSFILARTPPPSWPPSLSLCAGDALATIPHAPPLSISTSLCAGGALAIIPPSIPPPSFIPLLRWSQGCAAARPLLPPSTLAPASPALTLCAGGALAVRSCSGGMVVDGCNFWRCRAGSQGGAVYLLNTTRRAVTISNSLIEGVLDRYL